jgi:hypothetical protein
MIKRVKMLQLHKYFLEFVVICSILIMYLMNLYFVNNYVIFLSMLSFISLMFVIYKDIEIEEKRYEYMLRRRL